MSLFRFVCREIVFRKLNFLLGVFAVAVAVGCVLGQLVILEQHDRRTEEILSEREDDYRRELSGLEDDIRKSMTRLGFNLVIFAKDVNPVDVARKGYIDRYMPEEYVERLTGSSLVSINHLLPVLEQRRLVPEIDLAVSFKGTVGEKTIASQSKKKALVESVPRGKVTLGALVRKAIEEKHKEAGRLNPGDKVTLAGKTFVIHKLQPAGGDDDQTAWIHLKDAQEMFSRKGQINALYALGCNCSAGRLGVIRADIAKILPETQVEEFETKATARAEARTRAAKAKETILEQARKERADLRAQKEDFLAVLLPVVTLAALVVLAVLAFINVRERRGEIGLYRALGWRSWSILGLLLARASVVGAVGASLGLAAAALGGRMLGEDYGWLGEHAVTAVSVVFGAPLASLVAAWLPALLAVKQDPAVILQRELT